MAIDLKELIKSFFIWLGILILMLGLGISMALILMRATGILG
ncbi:MULTISPECIES: hypothetical protein [unclassified Bradyrhizobium]|nr:MULTISPECIES: hypothetical protein [unclassified Bradyrhizobium]